MLGQYPEEEETMITMRTISGIQNLIKAMKIKNIHAKVFGTKNLKNALEFALGIT